MAKLIPGKEEFEETLRYFRVHLAKHNVDVSAIVSAYITHNYRHEGSARQGRDSR